LRRGCGEEYQDRTCRWRRRRRRRRRRKGWQLNEIA
jgi:hypothetical protein